MTDLKSDFTPFSGEADSFSLDELTIENRVDRIELYGSLQITKDKQGLALAREFKQMLDATVKTLQAEKNLPDKVEEKPAETVKNPFAP